MVELSRCDTTAVQELPPRRATVNVTEIELNCSAWVDLTLLSSSIREEKIGKKLTVDLIVSAITSLALWQRSYNVPIIILFITIARIFSSWVYGLAVGKGAYDHLLQWIDI